MYIPELEFTAWISYIHRKTAPARGKGAHNYSGHPGALLKMMRKFLALVPEHAVID